jgi:thiamine-phosphate pyrophosphorylase
MSENETNLDENRKTEVWRSIDANLNRCGEGLRAIEDVFRFCIGDQLLSKSVKKMRHQLAAIANPFERIDLIAARDSGSDVGRRIKTKSEYQRDSIHTIVISNFQRIEQSLRSLEEFSKMVVVDVAQEFEALRYETYSLQKAAETLLYSCDVLEAIRICVLVGVKESEGHFRQFVEQVLAQGPMMIQLRDKSADDQTLVSRGQILNEVTRGTESIWIMNDRADLAAVCEADGVHLGQDDLTVSDARKIVGTRKLVGVSTHDILQARQAVMAGANYLGVGPTFDSNTKSFGELAGLDYVRAVAQEISLPAFAIGGIDGENLDQVLQAGATRIAISNAANDANGLKTLFAKMCELAESL